MDCWSSKHGVAYHSSTNFASSWSRTRDTEIHVTPGGNFTPPLTQWLHYGPLPLHALEENVTKIYVTRNKDPEESAISFVKHSQLRC